MEQGEIPEDARLVAMIPQGLGAPARPGRLPDALRSDDFDLVASQASEWQTPPSSASLWEMSAVVQGAQESAAYVRGVVLRFTDRGGNLRLKVSTDPGRFRSSLPLLAGQASVRQRSASAMEVSRQPTCCSVSCGSGQSSVFRQYEPSAHLRKSGGRYRPKSPTSST